MLHAAFLKTVFVVLTVLSAWQVQCPVVGLKQKEIMYPILFALFVDDLVILLCGLT